MRADPSAPDSASAASDFRVEPFPIGAATGGAFAPPCAETSSAAVLADISKPRERHHVTQSVSMFTWFGLGSGSVSGSKVSARVLISHLRLHAVGIVLGDAVVDERARDVDLRPPAHQEQPAR